MNSQQKIKGPIPFSSAQYRRVVEGGAVMGVTSTVPL